MSKVTSNWCARISKKLIQFTYVVVTGTKLYYMCSYRHTPAGTFTHLQSKQNQFQDYHICSKVHDESLTIAFLFPHQGTKGFSYIHDLLKCLQAIIQCLPFFLQTLANLKAYWPSYFSNITMRTISLKTSDTLFHKMHNIKCKSKT